MHLVTIAHNPMPSTAANGVQIARMADAFAQFAATSTLIVPSGADTATIHDFYGIDQSVGVIAVAKPARLPGRSLVYAARSARRAGRLKPHLVLTRSARVAAATTRRRLPTVLELHTDQTFNTPGRLAALRRVAARDDFVGIVVISQALADELVQVTGWSDVRVVVAHDAASDSGVLVTAPGSDDGLQVGYVGSLHPGKGFDLIVALAEQLPDMTFHVVGDPEPQLGRPLPENVKLHGFVSPAEVTRMHAMCDVLLAPYGTSVSVAGGGGDVARWMSPLKIFEYMAAQRPMIASDLPVLREVLTAGENCLLAPPGDVDAWLAALDRLRDSTLRASIAEHAYRTFQAHHTYGARARLILTGFGLLTEEPS